MASTSQLFEAALSAAADTLGPSAASAGQEPQTQTQPATGLDTAELSELISFARQRADEDAALGRAFQGFLQRRQSEAQVQGAPTAWGQIERLADSTLELSSEVRRGRERLAASQDSVARLTADVDKWRLQAEGRRSEDDRDLAQHHERIAELSGRLDSQTKAAQALSEQRDLLGAQVKEEKGENELLRSALNQVTSERDTALYEGSRARRAAEHKGIDAEEQTERLRREVEALRAHKLGAVKGAQRAEAEKAGMVRDVQALRQQVAALQERLSDAEQASSGLGKEAAELRAKEQQQSLRIEQDGVAVAALAKAKAQAREQMLALQGKMGATEAARLAAFHEHEQEMEESRDRVRALQLREKVWKAKLAAANELTEAAHAEVERVDLEAQERIRNLEQTLQGALAAMSKTQQLKQRSQQRKSLGRAENADAGAGAGAGPDEAQEIRLQIHAACAEAMLLPSQQREHRDAAQLQQPEKAAEEEEEEEDRQVSERTPSRRPRKSPYAKPNKSSSGNSKRLPLLP